MLWFLCVFVLGKVVTATLDIKEFPVEKRELFVPPLEEIAHVLNKGLRQNYKEVQVDVVECPDLRQPPFALANAGLNGNTRLVEIGDVQYLFPFANLSKVYDVRDVLQILDVDSAFVFGASAGPYLYAGTDCEGIFNMNVKDGKIDQKTKIVLVKDDGSYTVEDLPNNETRFDILTDLFVSQGEPGPVLRVHVKKRIGEDSFSASIRKTLAMHYGSNIIGLGGTFILEKGHASQSLVKNFSTTSFNTFEDVRNWLLLYNMSAPLIGVGVLVTGTYELDLRLQHFHTFSYHGDAGHYNIDTTPEVAEYIGYFNTAEYVYRIDRPPLENRFTIVRKNND